MLLPMKDTMADDEIKASSESKANGDAGRVASDGVCRCALQIGP